MRRSRILSIGLVTGEIVFLLGLGFLLWDNSVDSLYRNLPYAFCFLLFTIMTIRHITLVAKGLLVDSRLGLLLVGFFFLFGFFVLALPLLSKIPLQYKPALDIFLMLWGSGIVSVCIITVLAWLIELLRKKKSMKTE